jgi:hypothetical protein
MDQRKLISALVISSATAVASLLGAAIAIGPAILTHGPIALAIAVPAGMVICIWCDFRI